MEEIYFNSLSQLIHYYRTKNPARLKTQYISDISGGSTNDERVESEIKYVAVCGTIKNTLKTLSITNRLLFERAKLSDPNTSESIKDIARDLRISTATAYRRLGDIEEQMAKEAQRRGLLPPDKFYEC